MAATTNANVLAEQSYRLQKSQDELRARLDDVQGRAPTNAELAAMRDYQARADSVYRGVGLVGAPLPQRNESADVYRRRLATGLQRFSPKWKEARLFALPADAVDAIEPEIYRAAAAVAADPTWTNKVGELREVMTRDDSGRAIKTFAGDPRVWMDQFAHPRINVTAIRSAPDGPDLSSRFRKTLS